MMRTVGYRHSRWYVITITMVGVPEAASGRRRRMLGTSLTVLEVVFAYFCVMTMMRTVGYRHPCRYWIMIILVKALEEV